MTSGPNPFDHEFKADDVVPSDATLDADPVPPIETVENFKRRLTRLRPEELECLLARMKADEPLDDPRSQPPG